MATKPPRQRKPWQADPATEARKRKAEHDRRRPGSAERGYDHLWRRLRLQILAAEPLCRACAAEGRTEPATVVDHIVPIAERPDLRLEASNCCPLCHHHHNRKTATSDGGFGNRRRT